MLKSLMIHAAAKMSAKKYLPRLAGHGKVMNWPGTHLDLLVNLTPKSIY